MEIRAGYKNSEVGVIPDEWDCVGLGSVSRYEGGSQPPLLTFSSVAKKDHIRLIQIRDYKTDKYATYIPIALARRFCSEDEIMIGRYGPPIFQILKGINGAYNVALMKAIPSDKVTNDFLYYTLKRDDLFRYVELLSQRSSGQTGVDLVGLRSYLIALPSLPEQQAIATALSDIDGLISSLKKLIDKKKNIKQGVMRELLTGKKRLAGFSAEWKIVKFGTVCKIIAPMVDPLCPEYAYLPHIGNECIEKNTGRLVHYRQVKEDNIISGKYYFTSNDVLYGKINPQFAKVAFPQFEGLCSADMYPISCTENMYPMFLKYVLLSYDFTSYTISVSMRSGMPKVNRLELAVYEFLMPEYDEQIAISNILFDMECDIEQTEKELNKYRSIKQGMMQELLTGRIRLVEEVMQ